jgi:hypothetical protein
MDAIELAFKQSYDIAQREPFLVFNIPGLGAFHCYGMAYQLWIQMALVRNEQNTFERILFCDFDHDTLLSFPWIFFRRVSGTMRFEHFECYFCCFYFLFCGSATRKHCCIPTRLGCGDSFVLVLAVLFLALPEN